jgi:hypothetical protein
MGWDGMGWWDWEKFNWTSLDWARRRMGRIWVGLIRGGFLSSLPLFGWLGGARVACIIRFSFSFFFFFCVPHWGTSTTTALGIMGWAGLVAEFGTGWLLSGLIAGLVGQRSFFSHGDKGVAHLVQGPTSRF